MTALELAHLLIAKVLTETEGDASLEFEDLNGLRWDFDPHFVRVEGDRIVIGGKDVNKVLRPT